MVAQAFATIVLGLLAASGVAKLADPDPTTGAMASARLPSSPLLSRMFGVVEVVVAVAALATGAAATVIAAALLYLAFTVFTFSALANRIPLQSCGCFGREDTPPNAIHVGYNPASALALIILVFSGLNPIDWAMPPVELVLYLGFAVIGVYVSYLLMTRLPQLLDLVRTT